MNEFHCRNGILLVIERQVNFNADASENLVGVALPILPSALVVAAIDLAGEVGAPQTDLIFSVRDKADACVERDRVISSRLLNCRLVLEVSAVVLLVYIQVVGGIGSVS